MRSHGEGSLSGTAQVHPVRYLFNRVDFIGLLLSNRVKVLRPEIILVALGQGFHILETNIRAHAKGESVSDMPGSKSVAGKRTVYIGTCSRRSVSKQDKHKREDRIGYLYYVQNYEQRHGRIGISSGKILV